MRKEEGVRRREEGRVEDRRSREEGEGRRRV